MNLHVGNILTITDLLNSEQVQTFTYDALDRVTSAATSSVGEGQYAQSYGYDPATGNLASKSDVGAYSYSPAKPHAVTSAGAMNYQYDANGNMISRNGEPISYDAENHLTAFAGKTWLYDGDGKRVWAKDYEGYLPDNPRLTVYIGNYYEARVEGYRPPTGGDPVQPCIAPSFCVYFPLVVKSAVENVSYYYADGQRIAMKKDGAVYYLYGDQLGSVSAVADGSGALISQTLYHPWGTTRHTQGASPTDYAYTGQMQEGDIYFYNARWPKVPATQWRGYDPQLGRFMQADTFVPTSQGTQGFDRYAYVNNNPVNGTDPTGMWMCGDQYDYGCAENENEKAVFASMEFGLGILEGQSANDFTLLPDNFSITHYIFAREDDPIYINDPDYNGYATGPVPGLPSTNHYNYGFIYSDRVW